MKATLSRFILAACFVGANTSYAADSLNFVTQEFPPFSYEEEGKAAGPLLEVIQAACAEAKITCTAEVLPWIRALKDAEEGRVDGIFPVRNIPERASKLFLSDPMVTTSYSFFVMKSSTWKYKSVSDLKGMTVGVYHPSATAIALSELVGDASDIKIIAEKNNFDVLKGLVFGVYGPKSAAFANRDVGLNLLKSKHIAELPSAADVVVAGDVSEITYSFGLSRQKSNAGQMAALNKALKKLTASGQVKKILAKHGLRGVAPGKS